MATYLNEDFKSLPEQVEENKEKIKEIEDTIGGIDPTLVAQVQQNTNDIASIKAEQTTQNTAINGNASNITNLQNKTQYISNDGSTITDLQTKTQHISNDGTIINTDTDILYVNGNGIEVNSDDVIEIEGINFDITIDNGSFKVTNNSHVLEFDDTGALTIDGNAVGGAKLYYHSITANTAKIYFVCCDKDTAFTSVNELRDYLFNRGIVFSVWDISPLYDINNNSKKLWASDDGSQLLYGNPNATTSNVTTISDTVYTF